MRATILSLNEDRELVEESAPLDLVDRLDVFSHALSEFSSTLDGTERFYLFSFLQDEYESMKSDLKLIAGYANAEERRERSESPQRAGRAPDAVG